MKNEKVLDFMQKIFFVCDDVFLYLNENTEHINDGFN